MTDAARLLASAFPLVLAACSAGGDAPFADAEPGDPARRDAGTAVALDATDDAGHDAGAGADASVFPVDAASPDATRGDASLRDAATSDAQARDAAALDAGSVDPLAPIVTRGAAPNVALAASGQLTYTVDARGNTVPDFSSVGYKGGGVRWPVAPVVVTLTPPSSGDTTAILQQAIDAVSARPLDAQGLRGAILLKAGTWRISGQLFLRASGVVLRGEGAGTTGTRLLATGVRPASAKETLIQIVGAARSEVSGSRRAITDSYVPVGATTVHVASTTGLHVGSSIVVARPFTAAWIHEVGMDQIPPRSDGQPVTQWQPDAEALSFDRRIVRIQGQEITLDAPLMDALDARWGGGFLYAYADPGRLTNVGVENLRGDSSYASATDEDHAWHLVTVKHAKDVWIDRVTAIHYARSTVDLLEGAMHVTVRNCESLAPISIIDGGRRYAFASDGGELALFVHNHSEEGRHDYVTGSRVAGPLVFLESDAINTHAEVGPHHRWAVGELYDQVRVTGATASLTAYNRSNQGTGHGWAGANQVFWGSSAPEVQCEVPPTAFQWFIGGTVTRWLGDCVRDRPNDPTTRQSLYRAQLRARLGAAALTMLDE